MHVESNWIRKMIICTYLSKNIRIISFHSVYLCVAMLLQCCCSAVAAKTFTRSSFVVYIYALQCCSNTVAVLLQCCCSKCIQMIIFRRVYMCIANVAAPIVASAVSPIDRFRPLSISTVTYDSLWVENHWIRKMIICTYLRKNVQMIIIRSVYLCVAMLLHRCCSVVAVLLQQIRTDDHLSWGI